MFCLLNYNWLLKISTLKSKDNSRHVPNGWKIVSSPSSSQQLLQKSFTKCPKLMSFACLMRCLVGTPISLNFLSRPSTDSKQSAVCTGSPSDKFARESDGSINSTILQDMMRTLFRYVSPFGYALHQLMASEFSIYEPNTQCLQVRYACPV